LRALNFKQISESAEWTLNLSFYEKDRGKLGILSSGAAQVKRRSASTRGATGEGGGLKRREKEKFERIEVTSPTEEDLQLQDRLSNMERTIRELAKTSFGIC